MTIELANKDFEELWAQAPEPQQMSEIETLVQVPRSLGRGYIREIQLDPEFSIEIWEIQGCDDLRIACPTERHPIEFGVLLSGYITTDVNGDWNRQQTLISGGGIQRKMQLEYLHVEPMIGVLMQLSAERLATLFPGEDGQLTPELGFLTREDDWQSLYYPPTTSAMVDLVRQIGSCPYRGTIERMYLQAKALETIALQLAALFDRPAQPKILPQFKSQTIAKLHHAREIIRSRLDDPPTHLELSQQLDLSDRTLRRGFRSLFGTTVLGYLTEQRLQQADLLLKNTNRSVADIANHVGYAHLGYFARAFKRQYGINPSERRAG
jgi:AraC-like DNA-binding protein